MKKFVLALVILWGLLILIPISVFVFKRGQENARAGAKRRGEKAGGAGGRLDCGKSHLTEEKTARRRHAGGYIEGALAAEMPASFEMEALKAQAIAIRTETFTGWSASRSDETQKDIHYGADVCDDYTHCNGYISKAQAKDEWGDNWFSKYWGNIEKAVFDTDGKVMLYDGEVINAVFPLYVLRPNRKRKRRLGQRRGLSSKRRKPRGFASPRFQTQERFSSEEFVSQLKENVPDMEIGKIPDDIEILERSSSAAS